MSLDKIVVFVLALLFFGGIAILAWKSRKGERGEANPSDSAVKDLTDSSIPKQSKAKERRRPNV